MSKWSEIKDLAHAIRVIAPWLYFDCLVLVISIFVPIELLEDSLGHPDFSFVNFINVLNTERQIHELMLILIPIAIGCVAVGFMCAYRIGTYDLKVTPMVTMLVLVSPSIFMLYNSSRMFYFLYVKRDTILTGGDYTSAVGTIIWSLSCLVVITFFTSLFRHWPNGSEHASRNAG